MFVFQMFYIPLYRFVPSSFARDVPCHYSLVWKSGAIFLFTKGLSLHFLQELTRSEIIVTLERLA